MNNELYNKIISELDSEVIALCCLPENNKYTRRDIYYSWTEEQRKSAMSDRETLNVLQEILNLQSDVRRHIAYLDGFDEHDCTFKVNLRYLRMEDVKTLKEIQTKLKAAQKREADSFEEELAMLS